MDLQISEEIQRKAYPKDSQIRKQWGEGGNQPGRDVELLKAPDNDKPFFPLQRGRAGRMDAG